MRASLKILSPQNGGFIRASLVVPDSYLREFRAVARSATVFFVKQSLQKDIKFEILNGKMIYKRL